MQIFSRAATMSALIIALQACTENSGSGNSRTEEVTNFARLAAELNARYLEGTLTSTDITELPTGRVSYDGGLLGSIGTDMAIYGDMSVEVDFAAEEMNGVVENIVEISGTAQTDMALEQELSGNLHLAGSDFSGAYFRADLAGTLNGNYQGRADQLEVAGVLQGRAVDVEGPADHLLGSLEGSVGHAGGQEMLEGAFIAQR